MIGDTSKDYTSTIPTIAEDIIFCLGSVQLVTSFMLLVGFIVNSANLIVRAGWRERNATNEVEMVVEKKKL